MLKIFSRRSLTKNAVRLFSSQQSNQDEENSTSIKSKIGNILLSGAQETITAAQEMKDFLSPEDLQKQDTDQEVIQ
jgi:hypothetical protein